MEHPLYQPFSFLFHSFSLLIQDLRLLLLEHATLLHALKLLAHSGLLDLALFAILRVFKITSVTKFHHVSRLVHFALEATEGALNGFSITYADLNLDSKLRTARTGNWKNTKKNLRIFILL